MDSSKTASFQQLKINLSTRMSPVSFRFHVQVQNPAVGTIQVSRFFILLYGFVYSKPAQAESNNTSPLIVITNESQWTDAAGKLVISDTMGQQVLPYCSRVLEPFAVGGPLA
jgi:hypothetical protein